MDVNELSVEFFEVEILEGKIVDCKKGQKKNMECKLTLKNLFFWSGIEPVSFDSIFKN